MILKMQSEMLGATKIIQFHSHFQKETLHTFRRKNQQQTNARRRTHHFQTKERQTTFTNYSKTQMASTHFQAKHEIFLRFP